MSDTISLLAAFQSSCAFTTLLQLRHRDGFIWVFGMGEPGYEKNCIQNESKPETGCDPFGKLTPRFSLPLSLTDEEKRITIEVIENVNLPKEVEERGALSSTVINTLLGVVFKSRINFAIGKAVRHIGLHCLGTAVKKTLACMVIKLKKA